jgi:hypothetical protein
MSEFTGFDRPPAWPGYNTNNLSRLAIILQGVPDNDFELKWNHHPITASEEVLLSWGRTHPLGHFSRWASESFLPLQRRQEENWTDYSARTLIKQSSFKPRWIWCFSRDWQKVDPSPLGCAKRISYLLQTGLPRDWAEQILGQTELTYLNTEPTLIHEEQYDSGAFEFSKPLIKDLKDAGANALRKF